MSKGSVIREALGYPQADGTLHFENFLTEASIENIFQKTTRKVWGVFYDLGTEVSGFIRIIFVFKLIKLVLDTIIFRILLHSVFGFSWKFFAALFTSLANYLIHSHHVNKHEQTYSRNPEEPFPLATPSMPSLKDSLPSYVSH